jgi:DNA-binding beta-propeller fold protein YncE
VASLVRPNAESGRRSFAWIVIVAMLVWGCGGDAGRGGTTGKSTGASTIDVGGGPCDLALAGDRVWISLLHTGDFVAVDASTGAVGTRREVGGSPCWLAAADDDAVWVTPSEQARVERRNAVTGEVELDVSLGVSGAADAKLAIAFGDLWATVTPAGAVVRIDRTTGDVIATVPTGADPRSLLEGGGLLWVANETAGTISGVDPATNTVTRTLSLPDVSTLVAYAADSLWAAQGVGDTVVRLDPTDGSVLETRTVGGNPQRGLVIGSDIWVPNHLVSTVSILSTTGPDVRTLRVGRYPSALARVGDEVWIANFGDGTVTRVPVPR